MTEFVALRSKLYAYKTLNGSRDKKCIMKKTLDFEDDKHCLFTDSGKNVYQKQLMFRNRLHEVHTVEVNKVALNRDDDM